MWHTIYQDGRRSRVIELKLRKEHNQNMGNLGTTKNKQIKHQKHWILVINKRAAYDIKGIENIFNKTIAEMFYNLMNEMRTIVPEANRVPKEKEQNRNIP